MFGATGRRQLKPDGEAFWCTQPVAANWEPSGDMPLPDAIECAAYRWRGQLCKPLMLGWHRHCAKIPPCMRTEVREGDTAESAGTGVLDAALGFQPQMEGLGSGTGVGRKN